MKADKPLVSLLAIDAALHQTGWALWQLYEKDGPILTATGAWKTRDPILSAPAPRTVQLFDHLIHVLSLQHPDMVYREAHQGVSHRTGHGGTRTIAAMGEVKACVELACYAEQRPLYGLETGKWHHLFCGNVSASKTQVWQSLRAERLVPGEMPTRDDSPEWDKADAIALGYVAVKLERQKLWEKDQIPATSRSSIRLPRRSTTAPTSPSSTKPSPRASSSPALQVVSSPAPATASSARRRPPRRRPA